MANDQLRVLLIKDGEFWVAQVLEVNISVQARWLGDIGQKLAEAFMETVDAYKQLGGNWRRDHPATPQRWIDLYENAIPLEDFFSREMEKMFGPANAPKVTETKLTELSPENAKLATAC